MHILPTVFHTLPQVLTRRICLTINARASLIGDHFLYSRDPNKWFRGDFKEDHMVFRGTERNQSSLTEHEWGTIILVYITILVLFVLCHGNYDKLKEWSWITDYNFNDIDSSSQIREPSCSLFVTESNRYHHQILTTLMSSGCSPKDFSVQQVSNWTPSNWGGGKDNLRYLTLKNCDLMSWNTENKCNKLQQPETDAY